MDSMKEIGIDEEKSGKSGDRDLDWSRKDFKDSEEI